MKRAFPVLLIVLCISSCRTSRPLVQVMDQNAPTEAPNDDYPHVGPSVKTTLVISSLSLPLDHQSYDSLDLALVVTGTGTEAYRQRNYKPGEQLKIEAYQNYDIVLTAYDLDTELYSTKYCTGRQSFRSEEGVNTFTASLCIKAPGP